MGSILVELTIFTFAMVVLLSLSAVLVRYSVKLGNLFGIGKFSMAFILLAFATTIPELILSFVAATKGIGELGLGIVIGSNIVNLSLITGLIIILGKGIKTKNMYRNRLALLIAFMVAYNVIALVDGELNRLDGAILLFTYVLYLFELWYSSARDKITKIKLELPKLLKTGGILLLAVITLLFTADVITDSSYNLWYKLDIPLIIIGALIISTVTALPELFFEYKVVSRNEERLSLGDLMGAVGTNASLVVGLIALINPLSFAVNSFVLVILFFYGVIIIFFLSFLFTRKDLDVREGIVLVLLFVLFLASLFFSSFIPNV